MNPALFNPLSNKDHDPYSRVSSWRRGDCDPLVISIGGQVPFGTTQRHIGQSRSEFTGRITNLRDASKSSRTKSPDISFGEQQTPFADAKEYGSFFKGLSYSTRAYGWSNVASLRSEPDDLGVALKKFAKCLITVDGSKFGRAWLHPQATLYGKVESFVEDVAVVSMLHEKTGDQIEAECPVETLAKDGIGEGDEFLCEVIREGPTTSVRFQRLKPAEVTSQKIAEILKEVEDLSF